jgi:Bacterial SH3 domain
MRIVQSVLGILLGLLTLGSVVGGVSFLFLQQLSRSPVKPAFATATPDAAKADLRAKEKEVEGSYPALVTFQGELMLRDTPAASGKVVDKLSFDETVVVTGTSDDSKWEHIRVEAKGIEGWVGKGNLKRAQ